MSRLISLPFLSLLIASLAFPVAASAPEQQPAQDESPGAPPVLHQTVMVIGSVESVEEVPGSAAYISRETLDEQDYDDIHKVLTLVPGVFVQEEEGFGLRPNIGMRGTGTERSSKITLLEDGVLIAPAPYSAPSAYYAPTAGRMNAFEIIKGSSSITQGPFTTGGILNYVSTPIPWELTGRVNVEAGEYGTGRVHAMAGGSSDRFGWMLEGFRLQTDGFKRIDGTSDDSGFELNDFLAKLRYTSGPDSSRYQSIELKLGFTEQTGNETYLGLTDSDFSTDPFRRYAGSQADRIETEHEQIQLNHSLQLTDNADLTTTLYRNDFFRNWHKLQSVAGTGISGILDSPGAHAYEMRLLTGEIDDRDGLLSVRNNRRDYYSEGVQTVLLWAPESKLPQRIEMGIRYHRDAEERFQEEDDWGIESGRMFLVSLGEPGSQSNRVSDAEAVAIFVEDQITLGSFTVTPGLRYETIDLRRTDFADGDIERTGVGARVRSNEVDVLIPGIGVTWSSGEAMSLFGGVHRGFAPPGPGSTEETKAETSVNYEAGVRYFDGGRRYQLVGFYNDYDNLLGRDTLSSGGTGSGNLFNGGAVTVEGIELSLEQTLEADRMPGTTFPVRFAYTWTEARFDTSFETEFDGWGSEVRAGDELPYLPEHHFSLAGGVVADRWSTHLALSWVDQMRTVPGQGPIPYAESTEAHLTADLSVDYDLTDSVRLFTRVRNLTDEVYVAARRPAGARPGAPRTVLVGFNYEF